MSEVLSAISTEGVSPSVTAQDSPTEAPKVEKDDFAFSQKFSSLAKREQRLRAEREALSKDKEELNSVRDELKKFKEAQAKAKLNPQALLELGGLTFEEIQDFYLNNSTPTTSALESELRKEINELKAALENQQIERKQSEVSKQEQAYIDSLGQFIAGSDAEFLKADPDAAQTVYQYMFDHYKKHNAILEPAEAVEMLEKAREKEFEERYLKINKVRSKFVTEKPDADVNRFQTPSRTLTSAIPAGSLSTEPSRRMTEEELMKAASEKIRWIKN